MDIKDILDRDYLYKSLEELGKTAKQNFDDLECVILTWCEKGCIHHRGYGNLREILGMLEELKYILLRENIGGTQPSGLIEEQ